MTNMELYEGGVLVIWNWKWGDEIDDTTCTVSAPEEFTCASAESGFGQVSDSEEHLMHTVVFKCIGSNRETYYQEILQAVMKLELGEVVQVKLKPEPYNPLALSVMLMNSGRE